jgi:hypothetical protein
MQVEMPARLPPLDVFGQAKVPRRPLGRTRQRPVRAGVLPAAPAAAPRPCGTGLLPATVVSESGHKVRILLQPRLHLRRHEDDEVLEEAKVEELGRDAQVR